MCYIVDSLSIFCVCSYFWMFMCLSVFLFPYLSIALLRWKVYPCFFLNNIKLNLLVPIFLSNKKLDISVSRAADPVLVGYGCFSGVRSESSSFSTVGSGPRSGFFLKVRSGLSPSGTTSMLWSIPIVYQLYWPFYRKSDFTIVWSGSVFSWRPDPEPDQIFLTAGSGTGSNFLEGRVRIRKKLNVAVSFAGGGGGKSSVKSFGNIHPNIFSFI